MQANDANSSPRSHGPPRAIGTLAQQARPLDRRRPGHYANKANLYLRKDRKPHECGFP
jgi:hypothetical protein